MHWRYIISEILMENGDIVQKQIQEKEDKKRIGWKEKNEEGR